LLNSSVSYFYYLKNTFNKVKLLQKSGSCRPRLVAVVFSLKRFWNHLISCQLISVKATNCLPCLLFWPNAGKRLAVSTFCGSNFSPQPPSDRGYHWNDSVKAQLVLEHKTEIDLTVSVTVKQPLKNYTWFVLRHFRLFLIHHQSKNKVTLGNGNISNS